MCSRRLCRRCRGRGTARWGCVGGAAGRAAAVGSGGQRRRRRRRRIGAGSHGAPLPPASLPHPAARRPPVHAGDVKAELLRLVELAVWDFQRHHDHLLALQPGCRGLQGPSNARSVATATSGPDLPCCTSPCRCSRTPAEGSRRSPLRAPRPPGPRAAAGRRRRGGGAPCPRRSTGQAGFFLECGLEAESRVN